MSKDSRDANMSCPQAPRVRWESECTRGTGAEVAQCPVASAGWLWGTSGLTLAEMMVTIALSLILAAIAIPTTTVLVRSHQLSTSANELGMHLTLVRSMAIARSTDVRLLVKDNGYFVEERDVTTGTWRSVGGFTLLPAAVTFTDSGQRVVEFASTGTATSAQLSLSDGKSTKVVSVSRLGYVKIS